MGFGRAAPPVLPHQSDTLITVLKLPHCHAATIPTPRPDYSLLIGPNWLHMWPRVTAERRHDVTHTHSLSHTFLHNKGTYN